MKTEKRNSKPPQKKSIFEEFLSHLSPQDRKRFEENAKKVYVVGTRFSHDQIMELLIGSLDEEE